MPTPSRPRRDRSAVAAGVAAAAAGLGAGELVAAVFSAAASPVLSVGSLVVDLAPPGVKSAVIALFGTQDFQTLPLMMFRALGAYRNNDAAAIAALLLLLTLGAIVGLPKLFGRLTHA